MAATDLIISEVIEGSSNNKAIELYNGTGAAIDLAAAGYKIVMYFNGSTSAGLTISLTGIVQSGEVFVLSQASANALILAQADQTNGSGWFNGDDAIVLVKGAANTVIDSFGQVGVDPGTEWGSGLASTADNTLVRDASVTSGDTIINDAFNPATGWTGFATDTFSNLGSHTAVAGPPPGPSYAIAPLSADKSEGDAGLTSFTFTVSRTVATDAETIAWSATGETSGADAADFAGGMLPSGSVSFAAGETSKVITVQVAGDLLVEFAEVFTVTLAAGTNPSATGTIRNDDVVLTEISAIQGTAHRSPLEGQQVSVLAIVTEKTSNGFWIQDPTPDADARTSEAIFVFTGSTPAGGIVPGAEVRVTGTVSEFFPNSDTTAELSVTQLSIGATGSVQLTGNTGTIAATIVGVGGLLPPTEAYGDDQDLFDPETQALDFWESLEGMTVTLTDVVASGPSDTNGFDDSQVFSYLDGTGAGIVSPNGGLVMRDGDTNPERIAIQEDDRIFDNDFRANTGDRLGDVTGIVSYDRAGFYEVIATSAFTVTAGGIAKETSTELAGDADHLTIATYNAENLTVGNPQEKFDAIAAQIVSALNSPDIVALQEIQDDSGATNNGVTTSDATLQKLVDAIAAAGGPTYAFAYVEPVNNQDGGQTGGNIRQAFLYNPERVQLADATVGGATEALQVIDLGTEADLSASLGRIDPTDPAFARDSTIDYSASRKPLVGQFVFNGETLFVINNHFASKIGDDPLFGANQPPEEETEAQRIAQAQVVAAFVAQILAADPDANIAVVGDLNDYPFSDSVETIDDAGLTNLSDLLPENERYDYNFQGNAQQLDHVLVSGNLGENALFDVLRINAEFWDQTSDHDPLIARLEIAAAQTIDGGNGADVLVGGAGNDLIRGQNGADLIEGGSGKDRLSGGDGDDHIFGGAAGDTLWGDRGADRLSGETGRDALLGGQGDDRLSGGADTDLFVFGRYGGADTVADYEVGTDLIWLQDGLTVKTAVSADVNGDGKADLVLGLGIGGSVTLLGVSDLSQLSFATATDLSNYNLVG